MTVPTSSSSLETRFMVIPEHPDRVIDGREGYGGLFSLSLFSLSNVAEAEEKTDGGRSALLADTISLFNTFDNCLACSGQDLLYAQTPSVDLWPVLSMISCLSTPLWNNRVAAVTLKE